MPFCPQCGAPQIRVSAVEQAPPSAVSAETPDQAQPPAQPSLPPAVPVSDRSIDWSQAVPVALTAGVLLAISWVVPLAKECLWTLAGGALTVALYARRRPAAQITPAMGARMGALAGLIGFCLFSILLAFQLLIFGRSGNLRSLLQQMVQQSGRRNSDPRVQEMLQRMMSPEGLALVVTVGLVMFLVGFVAFAAFGGALGASLFGRKRQP